MKGVIDADTHVVESDAIWQKFDKELWNRRPVAIRYEDPATHEPRNAWLIDGDMIPKPLGKGGHALQTPPVDPQEATSRYWAAKMLHDIRPRLEDADLMGVDVQVIFPTLFIAHLTWDPEMDAALARAYNRFMADVWTGGAGRLRWMAVLPFHDVSACIAELNWARERGAVGFIARGIEGNRSLAESYFFPIYEEASRLNMPMCVHTGPGCPPFTAVIDNSISGSFPAVRMLPLMAFNDLVTQRVPERFPDLRIGFIETGMSWVPYVLHFVERNLRRRKQLDVPHLGPELFRDYRIFVACESDEDIPYLAGYIGEDNIVTGSDYGHHFGQLPTLEPISFTNRARGGDASADLAVVGTLLAREDLSSVALDKMLRQNPQRLYGI
ncbi:MAG: amidohydrolase family protein [Chloroflexi bacterium]|nr:amidohydrolase family protein [Chloroflexota bacterium]